MSRRPRSKERSRERSREIDPPITIPRSWRVCPRGLCGSSPNTSIRSSGCGTRRWRHDRNVRLSGIHSREHSLAHLQSLRKAGKRRNTPEHRVPPARTPEAGSRCRATTKRRASWRGASRLGRCRWRQSPQVSSYLRRGGPGNHGGRQTLGAEAGGKIHRPEAYQLPHEQRPNDFIKPELSFMFTLFFHAQAVVRATRKAADYFPADSARWTAWEMLTLMRPEAAAAQSDSNYGRNIGTVCSTGSTCALRKDQPARIRPAGIPPIP